MKIISETTKLIHPLDLKPGEIALIIQWNRQYEGKLIQYCKERDMILEVGGESYWSDTSFIKSNKDLRVRVLPVGTVIEI